MVVVGACASERELPDASPVAGVHPSGILDEASPEFHGKELARRGYDLALCATCHGADYSGGTAKVTCKTCHADGPDACTTCHREGPTTGAHALHRAAGQTCAECHVVPATWDAEGHVRRDGAADPAPAEITFGALANTTLVATDRDGPAAYQDGTCSNVYCHGAALHAGGGSATAPRWDAQPVGGCTSCHGAPPPSHAQAECSSCHKHAPHLDGAIEVGDTCNSCHSSTPVFTNLAGSTLTTNLTVGAHQAHLTGASRLRGPLACSDCHAVPISVGAAGHLDSPLPAEVVAAAGWSRPTASCTNDCHGASAPIWTGAGQAYCGSCHGIPPSTSPHAPTLTLRDCATCHPSVDAFGNPLFDLAGASRHLDGVIDVF